MIISKSPRSMIGKNEPIIQDYIIMYPLLPIIDLVKMGINDSSITIITGQYELIMIGNNDIVTYVIMSKNNAIADVIMNNG